jgi:septal ring factor EnvC (AmiA/AmiB activator)
MLTLPRRVALIAGVSALVVAGYFARLGQSSDTVPQEFREARQQGSVIAQDIVNISNGIAQDLQRVNQLDREEKYGEALEANTEILERIPQIKDKATLLSKELERMTASLAEIQNQEAKQAAIESITNRLTVISRLFSYSTYLGQLSAVLQDRFQGVGSAVSVPAIISQIDAEVTAINSFNRSASEAMDRFDRHMGINNP